MNLSNLRRYLIIANSGNIYPFPLTEARTVHVASFSYLYITPGGGLCIPLGLNLTTIIPCYTILVKLFIYFDNNIPIIYQQQILNKNHLSIIENELIPFYLSFFVGASEGTRTLTVIPADFKSAVSTNSTTKALYLIF